MDLVGGADGALENPTITVADRRRWISGDGDLERAGFARSDTGVAEQSDEVGRRVADGNGLQRAVRRLDQARLDHVLLGAGLDRQRGETARRPGRVGRLDDVVAGVLFEHLGDRQRVQLALRCDLHAPILIKIAVHHHRHHHHHHQHHHHLFITPPRRLCFHLRLFVCLSVSLSLSLSRTAKKIPIKSL